MLRKKVLDKGISHQMLADTQAYRLLSCPDVAVPFAVPPLPLRMKA